MKTPNNDKIVKKNRGNEYSKEYYKRITVNVRKDDYILKMLEKYRKLRRDESINSIVLNALFEYLNCQLSMIENDEKKNASADEIILGNMRKKRR